MRRFFTASALALIISASPAALIAQTMPQTTTTMPDATSPTGEQDMGTTAPAPTPAPAASSFSPGPAEMSKMDTWPAEQKAKYKAWPSSYQEYFWTLDADQQKGWWALTDEQKSQIYAMSPEQRTQVWPTIVGQVNGQSASATGAMPATPATPARAEAGMASTMDKPAASTGNMASPPAQAMNKTYPLCSKTVTDSCRNRGGV